MNKIKNLTIIFGITTIFLLCFMSAFVSYKFCEIKYEIKYAGASAPTYVAFLYAIPFIFGIIISITLFIIFCKKLKVK